MAGRPFDEGRRRTFPARGPFSRLLSGRCGARSAVCQHQVHGQQRLVQPRLECRVAPLGQTRVDVGFLAAFGAGSFIYIGAVDLIPEFKTNCGVRASMPVLLAFLLGLGILLVLKLCCGGTA